MSFKYRFILSFVLLEVFFIVLIVSVNFVTLTNSSEKLISEKIESNKTFLVDLLKVPVSIYDLATLDDIVNNATKYINSIVVLDNEERVLSESYNFEEISVDDLVKLKKSFELVFLDKSYQVIYEKMYEDNTLIGSLYLIFDTSSSLTFIKKNRNKTFLIIFLEIILSTILSFLIGRNLTKRLAKLTDVATDIGKNEKVDVPFLKSNDEIGVLAKSMNNMQESLIKRSRELKESNSILQEQKDELIKANQARDDFLANVSHELKTPLNSINVISDVMMRNRVGNLDEKQVKNLEIINKCGKSLLFLINDILELSKILAGEIILNKREFNLNELLNTIYISILPQAENKNLKLNLTIDNSIKNIISDSERLKQIVNNFLSNALKFTEKGSISINAFRENGKIIISVEDEGIGIPDDKLTHIFDRFKQVDASTTRKYGGTGLGLAICKELANLLEYEIDVLSEVNIGSKFMIIIPEN